MNTQELSEIADLARVLYTGYFETAVRFEQDCKTLQVIRDTPSLKKHEAEALETCIGTSKVCDHWKKDLARLARLVTKNLPEVWKRLRLVGHWDRPGFNWDEAIEELRSIEAAAVAARSGNMNNPAKYFMSWREILDGLDLTHDDEQRDRIRRLNDEHSGPIIFPGRGTQPKANRAKLIDWWNGLEDRFRELQQRQTDRQATVADQHGYGKSGIVVPDISGGVKKRRKDRKA